MGRRYGQIGDELTPTARSRQTETTVVGWEMS